MAETDCLVNEDDIKKYNNFVEVNRVLCPIVFFAVLPISVAMITIGALYQDDCKCEPFIPIYNIVMGVMLILISLLLWLHNLCNFVYEENGCHQWCMLIEFIVIGPFCIGWFIAGNVVIYRNAYFPSDCNSTLYYFSFWLLTICYIPYGDNCRVSDSWHFRSDCC
ncbi:uncharacterized protein [Ptychodera flava]|uniref:uncharacterized protein n=1 Tax=Ptychodera flava TaxID=63121 RepID=UPI00396A47C8